MTTRFQFRRASASAWSLANPTLAAGELGYELNTGKFKIGDGSSNWNSLNYFTTSNSPPASHKGSHGKSGSDPINPEDIGAVSVDSMFTTGFKWGMT